MYHLKQGSRVNLFLIRLIHYKRPYVTILATESITRCDLEGGQLMSTIGIIRFKSFVPNDMQHLKDSLMLQADG